MNESNHFVSHELNKPIEASADVQQEDKDGQETKIEQFRKEVDGFLSFLESPDLDVKKVKSARKNLSSAIEHEWITDWEKDSEETVEQGILRKLSEMINTRVNEVFQRLFDGEMLGPEHVRAAVSNEQVEINANYSGDKTLLMLGRLSDQKIHEQLARLLYLDKKYDIYLEDAPSLQDIERIMELRISLASASTPVTYSGEMPSASGLEDVRENMDILWRIPGIFGEHGIEQVNTIEAHEKGHSVRKIHSLAAGVYVRRGFDLKQLNISQERVGPLLEYFKKQNPEEDVTAEIVKEAILYYLNNPMELVERMSQLKNYFGMSGSEIFTKKHLYYAKEHYVLDTRMDNFMTDFFNVITPETEDAFIEVMNNCGI